MHKKNAKDLLKKYHDGLCTEEEKAWLDAWYMDYRHKDAAELSEADYQLAEKTIWNNIRPNNIVIRMLLWPGLAAAVVLFCVISVGIHFYQQKKVTPLVPVKMQAAVIKPGGNKAVLILANGSKVVLEDGHKGKIAEQNGVSVSKSADGKITYEVSAQKAADGQHQTADEKIGFNTIETPRGGQYQIDLPDGTKIWLNASSRLTYPTKFIGNERKVTLKGEAYFEVAKNKEMPFKVQFNDATVEVLGTHFNIMSYPDEPGVNATLLEGSIKISKGANQKLIRPGQQANILLNSNNIVVKDADVEEAVAWKNGNFNFNGVNIHALMRQLCRWYDVGVEYQGNVPENKFVGTIPRSSDIIQVLKVLELNHIPVKVKDKTIVIGI